MIKRKRALVLSSAAVAALALTIPATGQAKKPPKLVRASNVHTVYCVPGPNDTVRAAVKLQMRVVNYEGFGGDWADHMEARARLEPTTVGISNGSAWDSTESGNLLINQRHVFNATLLTDPFSSHVQWRVHIKLIWHRNWPTKNIVKNVYKPFNGNCGRVTGNGGLPTGRGER